MTEIPINPNVIYKPIVFINTNLVMGVTVICRTNMFTFKLDFW